MRLALLLGEKKTCFICRQAFNLVRWTNRNDRHFIPVYWLNSAIFNSQFSFKYNFKWHVWGLMWRGILSMKQCIAVKGNSVIQLCCRLKSIFDFLLLLSFFPLLFFSNERERVMVCICWRVSLWGGMICQTSDCTVTGGKIRHTCECGSSNGPLWHINHRPQPVTGQQWAEILCPVRRTASQLFWRVLKF